MTALNAIMQAMADQITSVLSGTTDPFIEKLQVTAGWNNNPTPPSIDIYPATPFQNPLAYGPLNSEMRLLVRARVTSADQVAGQTLLYTLMDPTSTTSLTNAIASDRKLGNKVSNVTVEEVSGLTSFRDAGDEGSLMGATWTVRVYP